LKELAEREAEVGQLEATLLSLQKQVDKLENEVCSVYRIFTSPTSTHQLDLTMRRAYAMSINIHHVDAVFMYIMAMSSILHTAWKLYFSVLCADMGVGGEGDSPAPAMAV